MTTHDSRVLFLGAGASVPFGFPTTARLGYAIAAGLADAVERWGGPKDQIFTELRAWLGLVHHVDLRRVAELADAWERLCSTGSGMDALKPLPELDVIEMFSTMDVLLAEGQTLGYWTVERRRIDLNARSIATARMQAIAAMTYGIWRLHGDPWHTPWTTIPAAPTPDDSARREQLKQAFTAKLLSSTAVVTTNWDLFADVWLDEACGTVASDTGTDATLVRDTGFPVDRPAHTAPRPPVFKLHGSFSWLSCPRCQRLYTNTRWAIAHLPVWQTPGHAPDDYACDCGAWLAPVLVAPSYTKDYRNRHVRNIWDRALHALVDADVWTFVGYSLPADDVHIRALLRRAQAMRAESEDRPRLRVETSLWSPDGRTPSENERYRHLFGGDVEYQGPFDTWCGLP